MDFLSTLNYFHAQIFLATMSSSSSDDVTQCVRLSPFFRACDYQPSTSTMLIFNNPVGPLNLTKVDSDMCFFSSSNSDNVTLLVRPFVRPHPFVG